MLSHLKFLRGTPLDPFGRTVERRLERSLIVEFERTVAELIVELKPANHALATEIAALPQQIRGFDLVKRAAAARVSERGTALLERFRTGDPPARYELPLLAPSTRGQLP